MVRGQSSLLLNVIVVWLAVGFLAPVRAELQLTAKARKAYMQGKDLAKKHGHAVVGTAHVAAALFQQDGLGPRLAARVQGDAEVVRSNLKRVLSQQGRQSPSPEDPPHSSFLNKALTHADHLRKEAKDSHIAVDHLLLGLLKEVGSLPFCIFKFSSPPLLPLLPPPPPPPPQ